MGNFQILFPQMLQDLWGNIIPIADIWVLHIALKEGYLEVDGDRYEAGTRVRGTFFLVCLGNHRQLGLTLPHVCRMPLGCLLLPLRVDYVAVAAQITHELLSKWKESYSFLK